MRVEVGDWGGFGGLGPGGFAGEVKLGLDLRKGEGDGLWITVLGESVDPGSSGIAEAEELGNFVVSFAGCVVKGATDKRVLPGVGNGSGQIEVGVATGDDESQGGL